MVTGDNMLASTAAESMKRQSAITSFVHKALISFGAVLAGSFVGTAFIVMLALISGYQERIAPDDYLFALFEHFAWVGALVGPVWLLILLPLSIWLPPGSVLWRGWIFTGLGVLSGATILSLFVCALGAPPLAYWFFIIEAAVIGGVTCLTEISLFRSLGRRSDAHRSAPG